MKKDLFFRTKLLYMASILLLLLSCQKGVEEKKDAIVLPHDYIFLAEHLMNDLHIGVQTVGRDWEPVPDTTFWESATAWSKTPEDSLWHIKKDDGRFFIVFTRTGNREPFGVEHGSEEQKRYEEIMSELSEGIKNYLEQKQYEIRPEFFFAGIKDGARITADKKLFGRDTGSDLGDMFVLDIPPSSKIGVTYPDFRVFKDYNENSSSITFSDFFLSGTALSFSYVFYAYYAEQPSEEYNEVTFTIEIPIECEYMQQIIYGKDYPEEYYEQGLVERNENRVLRGSVTVRFED